MELDPRRPPFTARIADGKRHQRPAHANTVQAADKAGQEDGGENFHVRICQISRFTTCVKVSAPRVITRRNSQMPGSSNVNVAPYSPSPRGSKTLERPPAGSQVGESHQVNCGVCHRLARGVANRAGHGPLVRSLLRLGNVDSDRPAQPAVFTLLLDRLIVVQPLLVPVGLDGKGTVARGNDHHHDDRDGVDADQARQQDRPQQVPRGLFMDRRIAHWVAHFTFGWRTGPSSRQMVSCLKALSSETRKGTLQTPRAKAAAGATMASGTLAAWPAGSRTACG